MFDIFIYVSLLNHTDSTAITTLRALLSRVWCKRSVQMQPTLLCGSEAQLESYICEAAQCVTVTYNQLKDLIS